MLMVKVYWTRKESFLQSPPVSVVTYSLTYHQLQAYLSPLLLTCVNTVIALLIPPLTHLHVASCRDQKQENTIRGYYLCALDELFS